MELLRTTLRRKSVAGVTLVEVMVTVAILAIGVLAAIGSFRYLTVSIQGSKSRTLANNLAQEQIEKLKNLSYYTLLVTTSPIPNNNFTPSLMYDSGNYAPATLLEGGIAFTRATRVDFAYKNGTVITTATWSSDDTGLKLITTYVIWTDAAGPHYQEMHNLMANPAANPLNATFSGTVTDGSTFGPIQGALVQILDNPDWFATTNAAGSYSFSVSQGSYTLQVSSSGYFGTTTNGYLSITSGQNYTQNFTMTKMSSGTVSGYAFINNHLVISQVVASTGPGNAIEYIELYNPTTNAIFIGSSSGSPIYDGESGNSMPSYIPVVWGRTNATKQARHLHYVNTTIPANGFYLISNTGNGSPATACASFGAGGATVTPDACWNHVYYTDPGTNYHTLNCALSTTCSADQLDAGGVGLIQAAGLTGPAPTYVFSGSWASYIVDKIGWNQKSGLGNNAPSDSIEGTAINCTNNNGLGIGEQLVRQSWPTNVTLGAGRAYDSDNNFFNVFYFPSIFYAPYTSSNIYAPISGTPATGADIALNDGLSTGGTCTASTYSTFWPVCRYSVTNVSTGTWIMSISTGTYFLEVQTVTVTAGSFINVPNATTTPNWTIATPANSNSALLSDTTPYALIAGYVNGATGNPLSGITISGGGRSTTTSSTGRYFMSVSTGDMQLTANPANTNRAYTSQSYPLMGLTAGTMYENASGGNQTWFTLSLGGILAGYFQTGSNTPLPGRVAYVTPGGNQATSGNDGHFYISNISTGTYVLAAALDPAETATPSSTTVILASTGTSTTISTFTITNGLSQITGQVLASTQPITTGVLVLASTATMTGGTSSPPPSVYGGSGSLCSPCYYSGSSDSSGQYTLYVRSSATPYKLYGWYTTFNGTTPIVTRSSVYSVTVSTTGQIISQNITW
jgi:type II secretory pathway pseudopilin PulG